MRPTPPSRAQVAWVALSLAALFLYPLASALEGDRYYLHWQPHHSTEALAALALLWTAFGAALLFASRLRGRAGVVVLGLVSAVPVASLVGGVTRQLPLPLTTLAVQHGPALAFGVGGLLACVVVALVVFQPERARRGMWTALLVLSPITLVVVKAFVAGALRDGPVVARTAAGDAGNDTCAPVLALLFDELSFAYLYQGGEIAPEFGNLRRLASNATQHMAVNAPGADTLVSVPGYVAARRLHDIQPIGDTLYEVRSTGEVIPFDAAAPTGLFAAARRLGFRNELVGYYLPYCDLLGSQLDVCRTFSFYNRATVQPWSPLNPISTTLILWPRQSPFGLLKNPMFARHQRQIVDATADFVARPMSAGTFRFVHFSIPHLPFVFDAEGYDPPLDPLRVAPDTAYRAQLRYTDRLVGELLTRLEKSGTFERTTVVVFSDHGFRFGGRDRTPRHVPFIVKLAGNAPPATVEDVEQAEVLLPQMLRRSCGG